MTEDELTESVDTNVLLREKFVSNVPVMWIHAGKS